MMSLYLFVSYLMAVHATTSKKAAFEQRNSYKSPKSVFVTHEFCQHFNCPDIDDPQCVEMRQFATGLSYYFIAAHKCELKYLKCRDDVEGKVVAMKFCQHDAELVTGKQTNEEGKAHIHVKRIAVRARPSIKPHLREVVKKETNIKPLAQKQRLSKHKRGHAQRDFRMISAESAIQSLRTVDDRTPYRRYRDGYIFKEELLSYFKFHKTRKNWTDAIEICEREGSSLLFPEDVMHANHMTTMFKQHQDPSGMTWYSDNWMWVGILRVSSTGPPGSKQFKTIDGRSMTEVYNDWYPGEPDNFKQNENCLSINHSGKYNDAPCDKLYSFICMY